VVGLDVRGALAAAGLHDVGVEGALDEELDLILPCGRDDVPSSPLEGPDELPADDLALRLRVGDAGERAEERVGGVDDHEVDPGGGHEVLLHLLGLTLAQQSVVHEHAGELVPDGTLDEGGRDGRVHAAGESADHAAGADLRPDALHLLGDHVAGRPRGGDPRPLAEEVLEGLLAEHGVAHLGVPLHAEEAPLGVLERRDRGTRRGGEHGEALRGALHGVAVAHPHSLGGR